MHKLLFFGFLFFSTSSFAGIDKTIVVSSFAEKSLDPNMASLNVEVWSKAGTAKQAQALNASEFQKVKKTLDSFKVKKEDIQTESYSLNPEYIYDQKTQQNKRVGFRALQTLRVVFRKTEDLGSFLDTLVAAASNGEAGVNINTIQWDTDKRSQLELAALGEAVRLGRQQADELAKAANVKIKGVVTVSHGVGPTGGPLPRVGMVKAMAYSESASTEVMPGQVKVRVDVTTQYEIY